MGHVNAFSKKFLPLMAVVLSLFTISSCSNRVVIGMAGPSEPVTQVNVPAAKPAPKKPAEAVEAPKAAAPSPSATENTALTATENTAKPPVVSGGGMMGLPSKTTQAQEDTTPQSSPARPVAEPKPDENASASLSPYKLDLSFGGFGLGVGLLDTPVSVGVDSEENIFVVDQGNYRVQKFDRFGTFQFAWGRQGMGDDEFIQSGQTLRMTGDFDFNKPVGILVDKDDTRNLTRVTVVDSLNNRIQRFLLVQRQGELFPDSPSQVNVFWKLTKTGTVADTGPGDTLEGKYRSSGSQVILDPIYLNANPGCNKANQNLLAPFVWGGLGYTQGLLNNPTYITRDENNILYVSDTENGRVQGFNLSSDCSTDATFYREWGDDINLPYGAGRLKQPTAIAYDNTGFGGFLVLDKLQDGTYNIQKFDRDGKFVKVFAVSGDKEGQFRQPVGIAINNFDNTVFITDKSRRKVMVYNNKGEYVYEFGGEELADPRGIAVRRNNYVYVTDASKNMVYRYVPQ